MCCPTSPVHGDVDELRDLLETSAILDDDFDDEDEDYDDDDGASGHYVCEDCDGCHATNEYLLECLNHVLQNFCLALWRFWCSQENVMDNVC